MTPNSSKKIPYLETLRGFAAIFVLFCHSHWLLWEGKNSYNLHKGSYSFLYNFSVDFLEVFTYGHEAVIFFFVLSGFVIHLKYAQLYSQTPVVFEFDLLVYMKRRIKRIYPVLLFALAFTFVLDSLGKHLGYTIYSGNTLYLELNNNIQSDLTIECLMVNLVLLGKFFGHIYGSNMPLWSLQFEWWFYMIYPLFSLLNRFNVYLSHFLVLLLFYLAHSTNVISYMPIDLLFENYICWWIGVILADVYVSRVKIKKYLIIFLGLAAFAMKIYRPMGISDQLMALAFAGFIVSFWVVKPDNLFIKFLDRFRYIGNISYSLYITHFPVLVLFSGYLMSLNSHLPENLFYMFIFTIPCIIVSWFAYKFIENPFLSRAS